MGCLENARLSSFVTNLAKRRSICMVMASLGIALNTIRVVYMSSIMYIHLLKSVLGKYALTLCLMSIVIGIFSLSLGIFLLVSLKRVHNSYANQSRWITIWFILTLIIFIGAFGCAIASALLISDMHHFLLFFLFDDIRIVIEFFAVNMSVPIFSPHLNTDDGFAVTTYTRAEEL